MHEVSTTRVNAVTEKSVSDYNRSARLFQLARRLSLILNQSGGINF
jgi:hypothetical protein